ncbi:hypothetical protein CK203_040108 [Vitis vinifera]|uniref:Retrotransposon Copia-like N-terminal domain-containing protein n=1 Tax=Vitis vinifera TaxID=29760 RepID=A0A438IE58_VITVI|nr:hypothetical protein CK203_040108 [Vitis vinifera]
MPLPWTSTKWDRHHLRLPYRNFRSRLSTPLRPPGCGSIKPPSSTYDSFPSWQQCNDVVISWLLNSIHPDIASNEKDEKERVMQFLMGLNDRDNKATSTHQVQKQKTPLHCSYCDCDYHNIEKCYYLHGFPIGHKLRVKNVKPPNQCHSNANNVKVETNKKNNGGNSQNFANATGHYYKEDDWLGLAT